MELTESNKQLIILLTIFLMSFIVMAVYYITVLRPRKRLKNELEHLQKERREVNTHLKMASTKRQPPLLDKSLNTSNRHANTILLSSIDLAVPNHIESATTSEITISINNPTKGVIENVLVDTSDMDEFFTVEGEFKINSLRPGMTIKKTVRIKPKHEEGIFPIKIKITGSGAAIEKEYTIKVGGTEIY